MLKDYLRLIRLDKPIGTLLLLWPTLWALVVAGNGKPPLIITVVFGLGVFLTRSAGCVINDYADVKFDRYVQRTKNRPLASGAISKKSALYLFICLSLLALGLAVAGLKLTTLFLSLPALAILVTYPLMKRFFAFPQAYLGIAFSFGTLMAFVELVGKLNLLAYLLFAANLMWVLGYDTIYALIDKEDDLRIGMKTSAITMGRYVVQFVAACYVGFVLILVGFGIVVGAGLAYWLTLGVAIGLLSYQIYFITSKSPRYYLAMFQLNNWVGGSIFLGIMSNYLMA
ncbi:MAG: 4-hydroxybenzoate octaprenyltransferase [Burkholderiales bacterium]